MGKIKDTWYKLVGGGLLQTIADLDASNEELAARLAKQIGITREHAEHWRHTERLLVALKKEISEYPEKISVLKEHVKAAKEGRTDDVEAAMGIIRERMKMDPDLPGKMDMLRQQLRQECAYVLYLEENLTEGATEFNDLSGEQRKNYFERVDARVQ